MTEAEIGRIAVGPPPLGAGRAGAGEGLIAIAMATYNPDMDLFRAQIESLRAQTDTNWVCVVNDDRSRPERYREIVAELDGDERFVISRADRRLGFYRSFERALGLVPDEAQLVALCDQDDRWYPEKLAVLRERLGKAQLIYSDQRLVDTDGNVLADTYWTSRRNNHTNLLSLLIANTITGAASLMRREVVERALPFPEVPGEQYHDHWLGLVAMTLGDVGYVDRPLYDYVQHGGAALGHAAANAGVGGGEPPSPEARDRVLAVAVRGRASRLLQGLRSTRGPGAGAGREDPGGEPREALGARALRPRGRDEGRGALAGGTIVPGTARPERDASGRADARREPALAPYPATPQPGVAPPDRLAVRRQHAALARGARRRGPSRSRDGPHRTSADAARGRRSPSRSPSASTC